MKVLLQPGNKENEGMNRTSLFGWFSNAQVIYFSIPKINSWNSWYNTPGSLHLFLIRSSDQGREVFHFHIAIYFRLNELQKSHQQLLQAPYPMASADDFVTCLALSGFILPQLGILWYFDPVADSHTVPPLESLLALLKLLLDVEDILDDLACKDDTWDFNSSFSAKRLLYFSCSSASWVLRLSIVSCWSW